MGDMTYSVGQLARLSGVSVRTLHHYEEIGLLRPARLQNGYRTYGKDDVERLQQILLYRACGMRLEHIRQVVDDKSYDACEAMRVHVQELMHKRAQLDVLIRTAQKTIATMEGNATMTDEERFEGIKKAAIEQNETVYGTEARRRFGNDAMDAANARILSMDEETWNDMTRLETAIIDQLVRAWDVGDIRSAEARELAAMHARWIGLHWGEVAYTVEAHRQLAHGYLADDRFRAYYDSRAGEGATEFLVAALDEWIGA